MTIYRTCEGHNLIRAWCAQQLEGWHQPHETRTVDTALGPTHVLTSGSGPAIVLIPGTNFSSATWLHPDQRTSAGLLQLMLAPGGTPTHAGHRQTSAIGLIRGRGRCWSPPAP